jgi:transposase-like protein
MKVIKETAIPAAAIKPRRKFNPVFKKETVAMWLSSGKSAREISADLGISESRLFEWKKQHGPVPLASQAQRENELAALRRENAVLRQQRDILKKTLGIVFEAPNSDSSELKP